MYFCGDVSDRMRGRVTLEVDRAPDSTHDPKTPLRRRMCEIATTRVRCGYRKIRVLRQREGYRVGSTRLYRLYRGEGLSLRCRPNPKRQAQMNRAARSKATAANQAWSLHFVADPL